MLTPEVSAKQEALLSLSPQALTLLVPFPPGGSTDFTARILADRLASVLDRPVEVVTRTGDLGSNAVRALMEGPEDRIFLVGNINANSVAPVVQRGRMSVDHWGVVQPVTRLAEFPSVVCTHAAFPADTLRDFLAHLKRTTGQTRYGTDFLGTYVDVDVIRLCTAADLGRTCMTTDGAMGILADLVAERTDLAILNVATATANAARLKPLAISGPDRLKNFPHVPTLDQAGFAGVGTSNWQGLLASRRASRETVAALHNAAIEAMRDPGTMRRFTEIDARVAMSASPEQFEREIAAEAAQWEEYADAIIDTPLLPR
jgi:tripartite-type tricarboxylate transporter receptor subunit TctC